MPAPKLKLSFTLLAFLLVAPVSVLAVTPVEEDKLEASDGQPNVFFGWRVDVDGDTAVVGAYRDPSPLRSSPNRDEGAAYVYERNDAGVTCVASGSADPWCEVAKLKSFMGIPDGTTDSPAFRQRFGRDVAIDGDTIVVGAQRDSFNGNRSGSAFIFRKVAGNWAPEAKIVASDGEDFDEFGSAVEIQGDTVFVGSSAGIAGAVYVFTRTAGAWAQRTKLEPTDATAGQNFGADVSASGTSLLIASGGDSSNGVGAGAAYVFTGSGASWTQQAKLTAADGLPNDSFGVGVSLFGNTALIGAPNDDEGPHVDNGSAYIFTRESNTWTQRTKLAGPPDSSAFFGFVLDLSGNTALVPADLEDSPLQDAGASYVYTGSGSNWTQRARIVVSDAQPFDVAGWGAAVDGDTVVLGAPTSPFSFQGKNGAAYVFDLNRDATPTGNNVPIDPPAVDENGDPVEDAPSIGMNFDMVDAAGDTTVTLTQGGPPPPSGFQLPGIGGGSLYFDIETTATFSGLVEICIDYSVLNVRGNPARLKFLHFVSPDWVDITSSNDTVNGILCGQTPSFSFFAIAEAKSSTDLLADINATIAALPSEKAREKLEKKIAPVADLIVEQRYDKAVKDVKNFRKEVGKLADDDSSSDGDSSSDEKSISQADAALLTDLANVLIDELEVLRQQ